MRKADIYVHTCTPPREVMGCNDYLQANVKQVKFQLPEPMQLPQRPSLSDEGLGMGDGPSPLKMAPRENINTSPFQSTSLGAAHHSIPVVEPRQGDMQPNISQLVDRIRMIEMNVSAIVKAQVLSSSAQPTSSSDVNHEQTPFEHSDEEYEELKNSVCSSAINTLLCKGNRNPYHPDSLSNLGKAGSVNKIN